MKENDTVFLNDREMYHYGEDFYSQDRENMAVLDFIILTVKKPF